MAWQIALLKENKFNFLSQKEQYDMNIEDKAMHQRRSRRTKQLPKHWDIYQLG